MDLLKFCAFLRDEKEQAPRSVYDKFENLMAFLKANGIRGLVGKSDWPRYTEEEPEMYEKEELGKRFAVCDAKEQLRYEFFLMTGMREQEVMYTYWSDVNFAASTVRVTHKPDRGWTPKAYKEREIPNSGEARKEFEGMEGEGGQNAQPCVPHRRMQPEVKFSRRSQGRCRACEARPGELLAPQVPCDVCDAVSLGWRRSAHRAAVAGAL